MIAEEKAEEYLTPEMVKALLRISESTLYRMAKTKNSHPCICRRTEALPALRPRQYPQSLVAMLYTIIYDFMWKDLRLRGAEKEVFAVIYGFWKKGKTMVDILIQTVMTITGLSRTSVILAKRSLIAKKLPPTKSVESLPAM